MKRESKGEDGSNANGCTNVPLLLSIVVRQRFERMDPLGRDTVDYRMQTRSLNQCIVALRHELTKTHCSQNQPN